MFDGLILGKKVGNSWQMHIDRAVHLLQFLLIENWK